MPEIPNRDDLEQRFARKFGRLARRHMHEYRELLGSPPDESNVPESFWLKMQREVDAETYALLLLIFDDSAEFHGWIGVDAGLAAYGWAHQRAQDLSKQWAESTKDRIEIGLEKLRGTKPVEESTVEEARESNRVNPFEQPVRRQPSKDEVNDLLDKTFGPNRVARTAIIETTGARSAGAEAAVEATTGLSERDIWCNPDDQSTCEICLPLIGKPRSVWSVAAPKGPPPTKSKCCCRCGISYEADRIRDDIDTPPGWGPMEWAAYWRNPESKRRGEKKSLVSLKTDAWYRTIPQAAEWRAYCRENYVDPGDRVAFKARWITLKPHGNESGDYIHVMVDGDDKITAGPRDMVGKKPDELPRHSAHRASDDGLSHASIHLPSVPETHKRPRKPFPNPPVVNFGSTGNNRSDETAEDIDPTQTIPESRGEALSGLRTSRAKKSQRLGGGVNQTSVITLANGHKAVWKPKNGEETGLRRNIPDGTQFRREAAASSVAEAIGLDDLVPPTVVRKLKRFPEDTLSEGSLQQFSHHGVVAHNAPRKTKFDGDHDLARASAFDILVSNTDRHSGNWLITHANEKPGPDQKLVLIDNGLAFPTSDGNHRSGLRAEAEARKLPVPKEVLNWDAGKIDAAMKSNHIEPAARQLAMRRLAELKAAASAGQTFSQAAKAGTFTRLQADLAKTKPMDTLSKSLGKSTIQYVQFFGHDGDREIPFGSITWDGRRFGFITANNQSDEILKNILAEPIVVVDRQVDSDSDPASFLNGLSQHYKSYALRATKPQTFASRH